MNNNNVGRPKIRLLMLTLMSVSAIISLRNFPMMALYGWSSVFFYVLSGLFFLIPASLACAELAAAWPKKGGVYLWVAEAFGTRSGIMAIWLEWIESVVWLPAVLAFTSSLVAYLINPLLAQNPYFLLGASLVILWSITFLNYFSIRTSSIFSSLGVLFGTLLPAVLIISLAIWWVITGHPTEIPITPSKIIPPLTSGNLVFFTGVLLGLAGIEVAAYHIQDTENPQRNFPRATFLATAIILIISTLGSLAIAIVVPAREISLSAGVMQAFSAFFNAVQMPWLVPIIALMALIGAFALLNTWIIGPSKGLLASAEHGDIPNYCKKTNRHNAPIAILLTQGVISSILTFAFLLMPSINSSYWVITVLAAQLILLMYMMVFASVIYLRYKKPYIHRPYRIPGGMLGLWLIAGSGFIASLLAIIVGFFPPAEMGIEQPGLYSLGLLIGVIMFSLPPLFWGRKGLREI